MRLASLLSGGKDSVYSIQLAMESGHEVTHAVTVFPERDDSYMFHVPNLWLTRLQADAMGVEFVAWASSGVKEDEVEDLRDALRTVDVEGVVLGAIASNYQRSRVSGVCGQLGLNVFAPLWGIEGGTHLDRLVDIGYRVMIVGVYADGMGPEWLGRIIDEDAIADLRELNRTRGVGISFEGGEAETLVLDCPIFSRRLSVVRAEVSWEGPRGEYLIHEASLREEANPE